MTDHVVDVGPVARAGISQPAGSIAPAFAYRCTCGAHGPQRVAMNLTPKARNEAREQAIADGLQHRREAEGRARPAGNVVDLEARRR